MLSASGLYKNRAALPAVRVPVYLSNTNLLCLLFFTKHSNLYQIIMKMSSIYFQHLFVELRAVFFQKQALFFRNLLKLAPLA